MSRSGGMSQLFKGIIIGVVLIMAIIGTMSILDEGNPIGSFSKNTNPETVNQPSRDIETPSITLNPDATANNDIVKQNANIKDLNAAIPEENNNEIINNPDTSSADNSLNEKTNKPILEDERTPEDAVKELNPVTYGMLELDAINPNNQQALKASYVVFDQKNLKVAESNNTNNASYRLPIGQYKIETTLNRIDEATNQTVPVVTKSRYIVVKKNTTAKQTFELEPPSTTGVLQVSANMNDNAIRADFIIQNADGDTVASRRNVTSSLFKLNTGTYKVTVSRDDKQDVKSVEVKAGESLQTVFNLKQTVQQGNLQVSVFDANTNDPIRADITITDPNGTIIQDLKASVQTELSLNAGDYKISVIGPNGTSNKNIRLNPGQALSEVFRFDTPNTEASSQNEVQNNLQNDSQNNSQNNLQNNPQNNETQITGGTSAQPEENPTTITTITTPAPTIDNENTSNTSKLSIIAQDEKSNKPLKSNIYIQTPAGKHLDKRTYVESASFDLAPGVYKVTVRATNRKNTVKTIRISENNNISETFLLSNPDEPVAQASANNAVNESTKPTTPVNTNTAIATGFLNVSMQAPNNQRVNSNALNTHFIVATSTGNKIVELTSVSSGDFKLDVGSYVVTAIHKNIRRSQRVNVRQNQNTRALFNAADFEAPKGLLRSRIVDESGQPLKGNLTVSNNLGQIVARANNVSNAVFDLPPSRHTISVNFQGLSGSEVVNINANETTIQTFTIAPNRNSQ